MGLNLIAEIMGWDDIDGVATREYGWLRLMSDIKFDDYADFRAGVRFIESLAAWLKQFNVTDRQSAYAFIKHRLIFVSPAELQCVIEAFVPEIVTPEIRKTVAEELGVKPYEVWQSASSASRFRQRLRRTLFVGLSDGSRVDILRRTNAGLLSTEQIVPMLHIDDEKWRDLAKELTSELGDGAQFDRVYLIDDFTASGTTFIRQRDGAWKGKLSRFNKLIAAAQKELGAAFPIAPNFALHIHHYISSHQARDALKERLAEADRDWPEKLYGSVHATEGLLLPQKARLDVETDAEMLHLCDAYYDHEVYKRYEKHCREAGQTDMKLGYADCALPVIMSHNTPNNSVPLLWAETDGKNGAHPMRPVFRRRDRHG
ncbi:MAG: hypothetical protein HOP13_07465 [Alphaproteobacteria bacterium]|nr:hypothetical protein [Alphaproteobacteria bacterium]